MTQMVYAMATVSSVLFTYNELRDVELMRTTFSSRYCFRARDLLGYAFCGLEHSRYLEILGAGSRLWYPEG